LKKILTNLTFPGFLVALAISFLAFIFSLSILIGLFWFIGDVGIGMIDFAGNIHKVAFGLISCCMIVAILATLGGWWSMYKDYCEECRFDESNILEEMDEMVTNWEDK